MVWNGKLELVSDADCIAKHYGTQHLKTTKSTSLIHKLYVLFFKHQRNQMVLTFGTI